MTDMLAENLAFLLKGDTDVQAKIAQSVGVTQPTISKWSRLAATKSTSEPEFRKMARLARALGVSLDDLAWRDIAKEPPHARSQPAGMDAVKLADLIEAVEATASDRGISLPPRFKARVVAALYTSSGDEPLTAQAVRAALAAVMTSLEDP